MLPMDMPYAPPQQTPIVLAQATAPVVTPQPDYLLKVCQDTSSSVLDARSAIRGVDSAGLLTIYLGNRDHRIIFPETTASIKSILLEGTKNGKLVEKISDNGAMYYMYEPISDYVGDDQAVFMAEFEGIRYRIVVTLKVQTFIDQIGLCSENPFELIKVNKSSTGSSGYDMGSITVTFASFKP